MAMSNKDLYLRFVSSGLGWLYVGCWSVSFYPQVISNYQRKSVTGLSCDYIIANVFGFLCYGIFNTVMYFSELARREYRDRHDGKDNLIAINDVVFAVHATILATIMLVQVNLYRKPNEGPSNIAVGLAIGLMFVILLGVGLIHFSNLPLLDFLDVLSFIKILLTCIKCIPQVWLNWMRRSTCGFSVANVLLDFFGGFFSIGQLIVDAAITGHWEGVGGCKAKLALGVISILFDAVFLFQHYIWFPEVTGPHLITREEYQPKQSLEEGQFNSKE